MKSILCLLGVTVLLVLSQPGCVVKDCKTHDYQACVGGSVYWFDSCDDSEDLVEVCECGCNAAGSDCEACAGSSLTFDWTFEGQGCAAAGVSTVLIELYRNGNFLVDSELDCTEGGSVIGDLADGSYEVYLYGKDANGTNHYYAVVSHVVAGYDEDLGVIDLDGVGFMIFDWDFDGMDCVDADVDYVGVLVYEGSTLLYETDPLLNCTDYGHSAGDFLMGTYNLVIEGICAVSGDLGYELDVNMAIENTGENDYGLLTLTPVAGGCL